MQAVNASLGMSNSPEIDKSEVDEAIACLRNITRLARKSSEFAKSIQDKIEIAEPADGSKGISFLELKNRYLLNYLMNLTQIMSRKCFGGELEGCATVDRLIEYRTVLEKMRPIQHKLKYQIEKAINQSKRNKAIDEALLLRPNLNNLIDDNSSDDGRTKEEQGRDKKESVNDSKADEKLKDGKPQAYIVPKINPVEYEYEEREKKAKKQELLEKAKRRAASTALVREFAAQFDEDGKPEEINELSMGQRRLLKQKAEKRAYEEEYFVRLHDKKKARNAEQQNMLTINTVGDSLTHFQNISALNVNDAEEYAEQQKSNRSNKHASKPKLPKKVAKKLAKRAAIRSMRKRLRH